MPFLKLDDIIIHPFLSWVISALFVLGILRLSLLMLSNLAFTFSISISLAPGFQINQEPLLMGEGISCAFLCYIKSFKMKDARFAKFRLSRLQPSKVCKILHQ